MPAARRDSPIPVVVAAVVASLGFHLVMWPVGNQVVAWGGGGGPLPRTDGIMEVSLLPPSERPEDAAAQPEEEQPRLDEQKQLVALDEIVDQRPPDEPTNFVSEFDSRVDKQTRAPRRRPTPGETSAPTGDRPDARQGRTDSASSPTSATDARALPLQGRAAAQDGDGEQAGRADLEEAPDGTMPIDPGRSGGSLSPRGVAGLDGLRKQWGSPGSYDDLEDVEDGDGTSLNSRRWKFASFFNRVRDQVAENWHPEVLHAANDPDGRKYGTKTRRTQLMISLNPDGTLHRVRLQRSSDVDYLDEEAIRAVRAAAPFANPPPGLVDANTGLIEFGFEFIFEINGGRRIFRYRR